MSLSVRPFFLTPQVLPLMTDTASASLDPGRTVLSALAHADEPGVRAAFPALGAAVEAVGERLSVSYYDIIAAGLPQQSARVGRRS